MRLKQKRLKDTLIGLDLPLQLRVFFGSNARLFVVRKDVIKIYAVPVCAEERAAKATLLPLKCQPLLFHITVSLALVSAEAALGRSTSSGCEASASSTRSITPAISVSISLSTLLIRIAADPRVFQILSCAFFSSTSKARMSWVNLPASANLRVYDSEVIRLYNLLIFPVRSFMLRPRTCIVIMACRRICAMWTTRDGFTTMTSDSIHISFLPAGNTVVAKIACSAFASSWS